MQNENFIDMSADPISDETILQSEAIVVEGRASTVVARVDRAVQDDGDDDESQLESVIRITIRPDHGLYRASIKNGELVLRAVEGPEQEARSLLTALMLAAEAGLKMLDEPRFGEQNHSEVDISEAAPPELSRIAQLRRSKIRSVVNNDI